MATSTRNRDLVNTLVINQLFDSPNYRAITVWLAENFDTADDVLNYISTINIDTAEGVWLDLLGVIVGQSRELPNAVRYRYFGFEEDGDLDFDVARFYEEGDPALESSLLPDNEYRAVIFAKAASNWGDISKIGVAESISIITDTTNFVIVNQPPAKFEIYIKEVISQTIFLILSELDLIPRGAGIGIYGVIMSDGDNVFGFEEDGHMAFDDAPFVTEIL